MKLSESLFRNETLPEAPRREDARDLRDTLFAGLVLIGIIAIAIDLAVRASDPYDIHKPTQRTSSDFPARAGHYIATTLDSDLSQRVPIWIQSPRDTEVRPWPDNRATQNTPRRSPAILRPSVRGGVGTSDGAAERSRKAIAETRPIELSSSIAINQEQEVISPVPAGGTERAVPVKAKVQTAPEQSGAEKVAA